jgi:hypothetical protein
MKLSEPFLISSRLLASVRVGGAEIGIEVDGVDRDNRDVYHYVIDLPDGSTHEGRDLKSGVGGGTVRDGMRSLLSFLSCGDQVSELFPPEVAEWADAHEDEIAMVAVWIDEKPECCDE